ncbi:MAG TPA: hypothetical protein VEB86_15280 [Chryseosolibacter sp.]|nr:hypothetical protein [Chryseosolibacter sp.]
MKKKILIIVLSNLAQDARVRRQVEALKKHFQVTVACFGAPAGPDYNVVTLPPARLTFWRKSVSGFFLLVGLYRKAHHILHHYGQYLSGALKGETYHLIVANDVETLPIAFELAKSAPVFFDAHEYAPRHFENKLMWRIFFQRFNVWLCRKYIPRVAGMTTVGRMLAVEYHKHFGVMPTVITNANNYVDVNPSPVTDGRIRLVHHGIATPSRNLHLMIEMMQTLDARFSLDMYLLKPGFASKQTADYIRELTHQAARDPRIRILPPLPGSEIVKALNQYDIGVFLLPPVNFNYRNTLPNKLFDFLQARLGIAIGPTPEMAEIVSQYQIGVISTDFSANSLAGALKKLSTVEIEKFKLNAARAAADLNAENNEKILLEMINRILGKTKTSF